MLNRQVSRAAFLLLIGVSPCGLEKRAAAAEDDPRRPAAIAAEGVPLVPPEIWDRLRQYENVREAAFRGWFERLETDIGAQLLQRAPGRYAHDPDPARPTPPRRSQPTIHPRTTRPLRPRQRPTQDRPLPPVPACLTDTETGMLSP